MMRKAGFLTLRRFHAGGDAHGGELIDVQLSPFTVGGQQKGNARFVGFERS